MVKREQALAYHSGGRPGKIKIVSDQAHGHPGRPLDGLLARRRRALPRDRRRTPTRCSATPPSGNLVAVVTNGTAVLGLGNIGALAGKPVMEGKAVLFKRFADIDVFDIEVDSEDPEPR